MNSSKNIDQQSEAQEDLEAARAEQRIQEMIKKFTSQESAVKEFIKAEGYTSFASDDEQIKKETQEIKEMCEEIQKECLKFGSELEKFKNKEKVILDNARKSAELVKEVEASVKEAKEKIAQASEQLKEAKEKHLAAFPGSIPSN